MVAAIVMVVLMVPIILIFVGRPPVHSSVTVCSDVSGCANPPRGSVAQRFVTTRLFYGTRLHSRWCCSRRSDLSFNLISFFSIL